MPTRCSRSPGAASGLPWTTSRPGSCRRPMVLRCTEWTHWPTAGTACMTGWAVSSGGRTGSARTSDELIASSAAAAADRGQRLGEAVQADRAEAERGGVPALQVELSGAPHGLLAGGQPAALAELVGDGLAGPAEVADHLGVHPVRLGPAALA